MSLVKQKLNAFLIHFVISLIVIGSFLALIYFVIYTPEVLRLEGGDGIATIILGVDLTLGPLMTLFLYRKGKRGMLFDLVMVGLIQSLAFIYGGWALYSQRPVYLAFVKEHFEVIPLGSINLDELEVKSLRPGLISGPLPVYVERPGGDAAQDILWQTLTGGKDLHLLPEYYRPYAEHLEPVRDRSISLEKLEKEHPAALPVVEEGLRRLGRTEESVLLLPIMGHAKEGAVVLDRQSGEILEYLDAVVW